MYKAFSAGLLGFSGKTLRDCVPLAVRYGYAGLDFNIAAEAASEDPLALRDLLGEHKLRNSGFGLPVEFRGSKEVFEADMKSLPAYCDFARKMGAHRCITWILPSSDTLDYKSNYALHTTRLSEIARLLEDYEIRFGLEFVGPPAMRIGKRYEFIHNLDGILTLCKEIGTSNLGVLLDAWHWDLAGHSSADFEKLPNEACVVMAHINDAPAGIAVDEQQDQRRELPGATGVIKIDAFMKGLRGLRYDGPVLVEPFNEPLKAMPFEEAVKTAKAAMDRVWSA